MTPSTDVERVTLKRARTGQDLWPAVEAAQFARMVSYAEPEGDADRDVITGFVEAFVSAVERWEDVPPDSRAAVLVALASPLDRLSDHGLFVHWGYVERHFVSDDEDVETTMPLAIVSVDRVDTETLQADIPTNLSEGGEELPD